MRLVDTHAHLDELAFEPDVADVVRRARDAGVTTILTIGVTADTSRRAVALAERFPEVYAVVGIQPNYVSQMQSGDWDDVVALSRHSRVVGIGETGLDRYWDYAPIDQQVEWFDRHLDLAREVDKPFVVHCREAEADVVSQLQRASLRGPLRGVMHSFCGGSETLAACLDLGLMISFAGMVTYKKNDDLRSIAAAVPGDRLLVETDSPYLSPVPHRGKRNEPVNVRHTAQCLADQRGVSLEELAAQTTSNAVRTFQLPDR
ncbi:MAG: TatD family hydrolase [Planctomycetaceae bacterium]